MTPLIAVLLFAAPVTMAGAQAQPEPRVFRDQVQVAPNNGPQRHVLACRQGEQLLSGGYAKAAPELRVTGSYPVGGREAWAVEVHNPANTSRAIELTVLCAAVKSEQVSSAGTKVSCPDGTVVTAGGYRSQWLPRQGGAAIVGSYPDGGNGWGIDIVQLPPAPEVRPGSEVQTFAVCASGVEARDRPVKALEVPAGQQQCTGGSEIFAPVCTWARAAEATVECEATLAGAGYRLTAGKLPNYSVVASAPEQGSWQIRVNGRSDDSQPLALRLTGVCVSLPGGPNDPADPAPVAERDEILPILAGACLAGALFLTLVLVMVARLRARGRRPRPHAQVSVVLRSHRSGYRWNEQREVR